MISGKTKVLAILGNPVTHSLSPQMHAGWIADHGIDAAYVALQLEKDGVEDTLRALKRVGLHGANVTVPFKEAAARVADDCFPDTMGAANTLVWRDGQMIAHNTDAYGAQLALQEAAPDWAKTTRTLLLVGAGGAARAMLHGLTANDPHVIVSNRTRTSGDRLVADWGEGEVCDWADLPAAISRADLIVNATTLGMTGKESMTWPLEGAKDTAIVYDAVYAPLDTDLLKTARARGLRTVDGLGMLIHQGALAFEIWFGIKPDTAKARERLLAIMAARA
jgi:shikimate dehydrogenase